MRKRKRTVKLTKVNFSKIVNKIAVLGGSENYFNAAKAGDRYSIELLTMYFDWFKDKGVDYTTLDRITTKILEKENLYGKFPPLSMFAKYLQEELETETELQKLINKYIK
jgi:hypothetical protein